MDNDKLIKFNLNTNNLSNENGFAIFSQTVIVGAKGDLMVPGTV